MATPNTPRRRGRGISVVVRVADESFDFDAWAKLYVARVLEAEGGAQAGFALRHRRSGSAGRLRVLLCATGAVPGEGHGPESRRAGERSSRIQT